MWHKIIEITSASFTSIVRLANIMQQVGSSIFLFAFHFHSLELEYCLQINIFLCASCDYKSVAYLIFYFIARTFSSLSLNVCLFPLSPLLSPLDSRSLVAYNKQLCGFANCMIHFVYMYLCTVKELARHIGIYKRSNWMKNAVEREMELWNELFLHMIEIAATPSASHSLLNMHTINIISALSAIWLSFERNIWVKKMLRFIACGIILVDFIACLQLTIIAVVSLYHYAHAYILHYY